MQIPFVNLKAQYETLKDEVAEAIQGILDSAQFIGGEALASFERDFAEYCQARHVGDDVTVKISGLPTYETITDKLDGKTFSGSSITLTAAQVNSGLSLSSSYGGHGHPTATLTVTATDSTGTPITSAAQTITVKDPPATTSSGTSTTASGHGRADPSYPPVCPDNLVDHESSALLERLRDAPGQKVKEDAGALSSVGLGGDTSKS